MVISRRYPVNGSEQQLYLNLCAQPKATILFVHGGPGWADAPWAGRICERLWGEVNTVHLDQRGANRSRVAPSEPLTVDRMVADGLEVCALLKREHGIERPLLVGHSWGALLS